MRIVTRPDFDGLVCAALLSEAEEITAPILWLEPGDIHDRYGDIGRDDILSNLPYDERCGMWFDHHFSNQMDKSVMGAFRIAPSAAGIIYEYYKDRFVRDYRELVTETDKIDSAGFSEEEVLHPEKNPYILLSMTISGRAGTQGDYWVRLVELLRHEDIQSVVSDAEVSARCERVIEENTRYVQLLGTHTRIHHQVSITDFRGLDVTPHGNRFMVYSLYPDANVNMCILPKEGDKSRVMIKLGHSIFNPTCNVNVGKLLAEYGGGGHRGAGSCRVPAEDADGKIETILELLTTNEENE